MKFRSPIVWVAVLLIHGPASGEQKEFRLASQHDWGARLGFYLTLTNSTSGDEPCPIDTLKLVLGVADGEKWHYLSVPPPFEQNHEYTVKAVIAPGTVELWLDGKRTGEVEASLEPFEGLLIVNSIPHWADAPADYLVRETSFEITGGTGGPVETAFEGEFPDPSPLYLFDPELPRRIEWEPAPGETITVRIRFLLRPYPDIETLSPFIDRYGQSTYADWPGKVRTDGELRNDVVREDSLLAGMPPPPDFDEYGGFTKSRWQEEATGFFRVVQRNGYYWFISPAGNPCFYLGVDNFPAQLWPTTPVTGREFLFEWLPPDDGTWGAVWMRALSGPYAGESCACFYASNLIRKYGPEEWAKRAEERGIRRLKAWAFSGGGKWGAPPSIVSCPVLSHGATPKLDRHPDIFDPEIRETFQRELERQILPRKNDPNVLGWSLGNEYHEIITGEEIESILGKPAVTPAKRALLDHAVNTIGGGSTEVLVSRWNLNATDSVTLYESNPEPPPGDLEILRLYFAERYYAFVYETVKSIDPNHLYFGFWITPGWWESEEDWHMIARHCDVVGYDRYSREFADEEFHNLLESTGKPVFCGEFSYPSAYHGKRGFGRYHISTEDDADAGDRYAKWVEEAARNPYSLGGLWFQYRNQPLTGRGPGKGPRLVHDEHYAFGLVDETDRPKWDLVRRMREANLTAVGIRLEAMEK